MNQRAEDERDEVAVDPRSERWLRRAFVAGALTDALAVIPLLHPGIARLLWGIQADGGAQRFAAHAAAALMAGWTVLLWWASRRPLERRDVAPLTVVVIAGLILAEIAAATANVVPLGKMIPTWILQAVLVVVFSGAYLDSRGARRDHSGEILGGSDMDAIGTDLAEAVLQARTEVRYVAMHREGQLSLRERAGLHNTSSSESDKYEELIVNPTLLTLVRQRGDIDCGGAQFVLIRYGNFFQFVAPMAGGHISIGMEPDCDPLAVLESLRPVLRRYGAAPSEQAR